MGSVTTETELTMTVHFHMYGAPHMTCGQKYKYFVHELRIRSLILVNCDHDLLIRSHVLVVLVIKN